MINAETAKHIHKHAKSNRKRLNGSLVDKIGFYIEATAYGGEEKCIELYIKDLGEKSKVLDMMKKLKELGFKCVIGKDYMQHEYLSIKF